MIPNLFFNIGNHLNSFYVYISLMNSKFYCHVEFRGILDLDFFFQP